MNHTLQSLIQTIYNLNWKGRTTIDKKVDWVKHTTEEGIILVIYPNAIDYILGEQGPVLQIKWELINNNVSNVCCSGVIEQDLVGILKAYLGY